MRSAELMPRAISSDKRVSECRDFTSPQAVETVLIFATATINQLEYILACPINEIQNSMRLGGYAFSAGKV